ncbi:MAG TPA: P-II family nitrogen regulator [Nitrososphaeraceae archaeon]|jgi:nitrogen regulatory protein P-II 1
MKKVTAYIRSQKALKLKEQLNKAGIVAMTIADITAWTSYRKVTLQRRGIPVTYDLVHMAKIEVYIPDDMVDQVLKVITDNTRTGELGDGIITVSNLDQVINITTLMKNEDAVHEP